MSKVSIISPTQNDMAAKTTFTNDAEMNSKESFMIPSHNEVQTGTMERPSGFKYWAKRLAVETGGIERVTDMDRAQNTSKVWNACTFWSVAPASAPHISWLKRLG
jgi:hypothetical protein